VSWIQRAFRVLLVLWAGSLWSVALWIVPTLFHAQRDPQLAGMLAGRLFEIEAYLGVATAALALVLPGRGKFLWGFSAAALLAIMQWVLRPMMAAAHLRGLAWGIGFAAWHVAAALTYGGACIAAALLIWNDDFR
jgi:Domain of unknown function (DUF4149)